jgi:hypothetical protein
MAGFDPSLLDNVSRNYFDTAVQDQYFRDTLLLNYIRAEANVKPAAGPAIEWTDRVRRSHSTGVTGGYAPMGIQPNNPTEKMTLPPAKYYAALGISNDEILFNGGPQNLVKLIDIVGVQEQSAYDTLQEDIAVGIYGDGSTIDDFQTIFGLGAAISATNTYAGVDRSSSANSWWRSYVDSTSHELSNLEDPDNTSYLPRIMTTAWINSRLKKTTNLIITTPTVYTIYEEVARPQIRSTNDTGDVGFGDLEFKAGVRLRFDDYCTDKHMFFLNLADWEWYVYPGMNLDLAEGGWQSTLVNGVHGFLAYRFFQGQLVCRHPRGQGKITSVGDPDTGS